MTIWIYFALLFPPCLIFATYCYIYFQSFVETTNMRVTLDIPEELATRLSLLEDKLP